MTCLFPLPEENWKMTMRNDDQLFQLILAHFKEIIREPGVIFWGIVFPILMALGLGIAFTKKGDQIRTVAVIEKSNNITTQLNTLDQIFKQQGKIVPAGKQLPTRYEFTLRNEKTGNVTFRFTPTDWESAMILLKRGNIDLILELDGKNIRYHFDPLKPEAQLLYLQLSKHLDSPPETITRTEEEIAPLTLTGTRYIDFLIPGLIAMGIMMSCLWGISYGIIDKRSKKLLRRMIATPMKRSWFLISLVTVRAGMNFLEAVLLFLFAWLFFHISIQGNILALAIMFITGNIAFSGIAILASCRTANTEIGNGLINVVVLPMMILSGIFFSYHNFPEWSIPFIQKLPLTLLADGIRSIFIEGAGLSDIYFPSMILGTVGILFFTVGLKIFKWY
jgi:ABC-2 type transport system permease protein